MSIFMRNSDPPADELTSFEPDFFCNIEKLTHISVIKEASAASPTQINFQLCTQYTQHPISCIAGISVSLIDMTLRNI